MMQFTISLRHIHHWFEGEISPVAEVAECVEASGFEQISVVDHVLMGEDLSGYPYGTVQFQPEAPWWEPIVLLGAIASRTRSIRLATSVVVAPLRPAALLAKQLTTLDRLSMGRVDAGLGVGWQKAEYDACGVPWASRFTRLEEQIRACKALWAQAPASFHGRYVSFEGVHQRPFPVQPYGIPIWLGISDSERNLARIADLAHGWCPPMSERDRLAAALEKLAGLLVSHGRDPRSVKTRVPLPIVTGPSGPDLEASLAHVAGLEAIGVTMVEVAPAVFGRGMQDLRRILETIDSAR